MSRLEQITRTGYQVKVQWEFEDEDAVIDTRTARLPSSVSEFPVYPGRSVRGLYRGHAPTP